MSLSMHFNQFFSTKAYFKVCTEAQKLGCHFFHINPYCVLILNDKSERECLTPVILHTNALCKVIL